MRKAHSIGIMIVFLIGIIAAVYYYLLRPYSSSEIRISANPWVGFTPFIYAQEKGWLEGTPFRFIWLVDLSDNARLYERGFTQGFTGTQYEWLQFAHREQIKPVLLIDRSDGADAILSNRPIETLRTSKKPVKVYLERGSLNEDFFNAFVEEYSLQAVPFQQVDLSQKNIVGRGMEQEPVLIISYAPYVSELFKKGYRTVASTRTMKRFLVIDALFVDDAVLEGRAKEVAHLKKLFDLAVQRLREDPREFYATIRGYLEGQSYEEFMASTGQILWLAESDAEKAIAHLREQKVDTARLVP